MMTMKRFYISELGLTDNIEEYCGDDIEEAVKACADWDKNYILVGEHGDHNGFVTMFHKDDVERALNKVSASNREIYDEVVKKVKNNTLYEESMSSCIEILASGISDELDPCFDTWYMQVARFCEETISGRVESPVDNKAS